MDYDVRKMWWFENIEQPTRFTSGQEIQKLKAFETFTLPLFDIRLHSDGTVHCPSFWLFGRLYPNRVWHRMRVFRFNDSFRFRVRAYRLFGFEPGIVYQHFVSDEHSNSVVLSSYNNLPFQFTYEPEHQVWFAEFPYQTFFVPPTNNATLRKIETYPLENYKDGKHLVAELFGGVIKLRLAGQERQVQIGTTCVQLDSETEFTIDDGHYLVTSHIGDSDRLIITCKEDRKVIVVETAFADYIVGATEYVGFCWVQRTPIWAGLGHSVSIPESEDTRRYSF